MWVIYSIVTLLFTSALGRVALDTKLDEIDNTIIENETKTPAPVIIDPKVTSIDTINQTTENNIENGINCSNSAKIGNDVDSGNISCIPPHKAVDNGTALILTPYIQKGKIKEARKLSKVNPELFLGVESYSGFLTVNETYNSNMFFWYFPVEGKPVNESPWIIWLQGGPGASSLTGLFDEFGPFRVVDNKLQRNPLTWQKDHSLLFIDSPVGTGYSFTESVHGLVSDMATYSSHLFSTVHQFLQIFPELRVAPLYVAGESYAGKYVPALGMELHKHRDIPGMNVNLQGFMIGNAFVHPEVIKNLAEPMMYFGLLDREQIEMIKPLLDAFRRDIENNDSPNAKQKWNTLITVLLALTQLNHTYNFIRDEFPVGRYMNFLKRSDVKRAIHVGDINFDFINVTVNTAMAPDFLSTSQPLFEELLEHYRVLAYCGQLDLVLPCVFTNQNHARWRWSGAGSFHNATRLPYRIDGRLAGFSKSGGNLTEVVMRGAGHMVPLDTPYAARDLISKFIANKGIGSSAPQLGLVKMIVDYYRKAH